ncbi:hypothetical protein [Fischerella sp. PCC 9605]|uniref:hypothetical protein n=1 Tax=Fischerella sp. PCC 9605 TaxID=1173024 RepID=UPI00047DD7B9|nr:hypothetical protein [Fischerella sp. PCC 9605]
MPSASSERYQSRLFNFVHKQSRRWSEGVGRTFRHLQVAASWSLEALMYPVFMLFQKAVESANKQLHAGQQPQRLQLQAQANDTDFQSETPPVADIPIQQVLQAVESLQLQSIVNAQESIVNSQESNITATLPLPPSPNSPTPPLSPSPHLLHIRGIASDLSNRQLVLVSPNNEILDILTPQQQQLLEDRIIAEVANYWRCWRLSQVKEETKVLSEINNLLIKLTSSSSENNLPALSSGNVDTNIESSYLLNTERSLSLLDAAVAKLETNTLEPVSRASWQLIQILQTQFQIFIYGKEQITTNTQTQTVVTPNHLNNQASNIQKLIWAAVNFFFGERQAKKLEQTTPKNSISEALPISQGERFLQRSIPQTFLKKPQLQINEVDLWLSESDLFGNFQAVSEPANHNVSNQQLVASTSTPNSTLSATHKDKYYLQNLINRFKSIRLPLKSKSSAGLVQRQKPILDITSTQKQSAKLATGAQTASTISRLEKQSDRTKISQRRHRQTSEVEAKPDWIETKAKIVGYDKHLLEQILELLDSTMLWLEELFVSIFQMLQKLWRGK